MKSIIFTGDNPAKVRDGSKTQTRRVVKPQPPSNTGEILYDFFAEHWVAMDNYVDRQCRNRILEPINSRYTVGDVLYVKEEIYFRESDGITAYRDGNISTHPSALIGRRLTNNPPADDGWPDNYYTFDFVKRSPMFMPRWAARTFIEITGVRCERVNLISEDDAKAEGCGLGCTVKSERFGRYMSAGQYAFADRWESIHGKKQQHTWKSNPWVFVYEFKRVE